MFFFLLRPFTLMFGSAWNLAVIHPSVDNLLTDLGNGHLCAGDTEEEVPVPVGFAAQQGKQTLGEEGWIVGGESGDLDLGPVLDPDEPYDTLASAFVLYSEWVGKANLFSKRFLAWCELCPRWTTLHTELSLLHIRFANGGFPYEMDLTCHQPDFTKLQFSVMETWSILLDGPT